MNRLNQYCFAITMCTSVCKFNPCVRTGKVVGHRVPGAGVVMLMLEGLVPPSVRAWFEVVKDAVLDRTDSCDTDYICSLVDEDL